MGRVGLILGAGLSIAMGAAACVEGQREGVVSVALETKVLAPAQCGSMSPLHVLDGILFAGQPSAEDLDQAQRLGVKTVINLRHAAEIADFDEGQAVESRGMRYVNVPFGKAEELTAAVFDKLRAELRDSKRPILLHCASANRVGAVWLPYRVLDGRLDVEPALAEAQAIGLRSAAYEARARAYVDQNLVR